MEQETKTRRENVAAGIVGAFLGTLLGVVCTVVISQMGYVASISGLIMAVGALKGYELLGGKLSKKGAVISSVLILFMTYLAQRISWAVSLMDALNRGPFDCFRAVPDMVDLGVIDGPAYWGNLVLLYLFTLLGAVPTIIGGLRSTEMPDLPQNPAASPAAGSEEAREAEFYPGSIPQMRPLRLSAALPALVGLVLGLALLLVSASGGTPGLIPILTAFGCIIGGIVMLFCALPSIQRCYDALTVMVRAGGTVWKVNLTALNAADTYRFTKKNGALRALRWDILTQEEQERAKVSILRAIGLLTSGQVMPGSALSLAVLPLTDLRIYEETKWTWKGAYSAGGGKEKKITIAKAYLGFAPIPGMEPVQRPVPPRWSMLALAVALTAVLGLLGAGFGYLLDGGRSISGPGKPVDTPPPSPAQTTEPPMESSYVGVTDEEARALFHVGEELGYTYTAVGYIKAPEGMFSHEGYVDAHVPYSEAPEYPDDGYAIRSAAHGIEVTASIARNDGNARTVVEEAYERMVSSGLDIYDASETEYVEDYDIGIKQVTYFEEDRTIVRVAILYADYKQDGYYLSVVLVYEPEQMDEESPALLAELGDAYALNLPEIEPMDGV